MNRIFLGALAALLFAFAGLFWLQGRAEEETGIPPPEPVKAEAEKANELPTADVSGLIGPEPPSSTKLSREQVRFGRYDSDRDGRITRREMLSTRTASFRKLDTERNNLLTFEEWAVATSDRFGAADADGDLSLTPEEFATTRPKRSAPKKCDC